MGSGEPDPGLERQAVALGKLPAPGVPAVKLGQFEPEKPCLKLIKPGGVGDLRRAVDNQGTAVTERTEVLRRIEAEDGGITETAQFLPLKFGTERLCRILN